MTPPRYAPFYDLFKLIVAIMLTVILIMLLLGDRQELIPLARLPTATLGPTATLPALTSTPLPTPTSSPISPTQTFPTSNADQCPSSPSRVQIGDRVRVLSWLNFRTSPGLDRPIIHTNVAGTVMEVIDGPFCTTRDTAEGLKAYLWWNVRMENGQEGWSAEAPLIVPDYFLEPIP